MKLSQIEAESKRLVLAFESRMTSEINWALNTLAIFSCNTSQNFTLENQPYLLESLANYLVFCIQHTESLAYTDPFEKRVKLHQVSVPSYVDAMGEQGNPAQTYTKTLDYRNYGSFTQN